MKDDCMAPEERRAVLRAQTPAERMAGVTQSMRDVAESFRRLSSRTFITDIWFGIFADDCADYEWRCRVERARRVIT
jgi:hypothetical protein